MQASLALRFDGPAFDLAKDGKPLTLQHERIRELMLDGRFRTLAEIAHVTGYSEASISAQLRHLRRKKFGGYAVNKRRRGEFRVWEYQVTR